MRATILAVAMLVGAGAGRRASAGNLLGAAALVVMAINPSELFRSGTQFSFLAVAVLMLCAPVDRAAASRSIRCERLIAETRPWPVQRCAARGARSLGADGGVAGGGRRGGAAGGVPLSRA